MTDETTLVNNQDIDIELQYVDHNQGYVSANGKWWEGLYWAGLSAAGWAWSTDSPSINNLSKILSDCIHIAPSQTWSGWNTDDVLR